MIPDPNVIGKCRVKKGFHHSGRRTIALIVIIKYGALVILGYLPPTAIINPNLGITIIQATSGNEVSTHRIRGEGIPAVVIMSGIKPFRDGHGRITFFPGRAVETVGSFLCKVLPALDPYTVPA